MEQKPRGLLSAVSLHPGKNTPNQRHEQLINPGKPLQTLWIHRTLELTLHGRWCWMATPQAFKPDLNFSNPKLTWVREVPRVTKAVCDWGLPGTDRVRALKTALLLFRKGKKMPTFPPHVRQDLFYHLGCRWELWSSPLLHRDNVAVQFSSC